LEGRNLIRGGSSDCREQGLGVSLLRVRAICGKEKVNGGGYVAVIALTAGSSLSARSCKKSGGCFFATWLCWPTHSNGTIKPPSDAKRRGKQPSKTREQSDNESGLGSVIKAPPEKSGPPPPQNPIALSCPFVPPVQSLAAHLCSGPRTRGWGLWDHAAAAAAFKRRLWKRGVAALKRGDNTVLLCVGKVV
jgi:hypothetical protein